MILYYPTKNFNDKTGGFYKIFSVDEDFPILPDFTLIKPDSNIKYPRWNKENGIWESDLNMTFEEIKKVQYEQGTAMLEAINSMIGGESNVSAN